MRRYILPHPSGARAHTLRHEALFIYATFLFIIQLGLRFVAPLIPGILGYASNINLEAVTNWTNRYRIENGLNSLSYNSKLARAAQSKAENMFSENYWAHVSPSGKQPWDFIVGSGYDYIYAGENLAKDFQDSEGVVDAWLASPSHRDNVLNSSYTEIGIAVVNGVLDGYETTIVVQMFGHPQQTSLEVAAAPASTPPPPTPAPAAPTPVIGPTLETPKLETPTSAKLEASPEYAIEPEPNTPLIPVVDVVFLVKSIAYTFGFFLVGLFAADLMATAKRGSGHTNHNLAHLGILMLLLGATWYTSMGTVL